MLTFEKASGNNIDTGVIEVTISSLVNNVNCFTVAGWVHNAVAALITPYPLNHWDHIVYALPAAVDFEGAAAYAYVNAFKSVYDGNYLACMGVQMFCHSGYGGATYLDHTGLMGTSDFLPQIIVASFRIDTNGCSFALAPPQATHPTWMINIKCALTRPKVSSLVGTATAAAISI
jgi:hypothetical protein